MGEIIIRWTARLAVACYLARVAYDICDSQSTAMQKKSRLWWTMGCAIFLIHVAAAFHFEHGWNHAKAFDATAERTNEMTGWNSGVGLYINEAFLCLWLVDTVMWWRTLSWPLIHRSVYWTVQAIFALLMFQATFVFGPTFWKPLGMLLSLGLTLQWMACRQKRLARTDDD